MKIYNVVEVSKILKLTPLTVAEYIRAGKITAFKVGKEWRMTDEDIEKFIQDRRDEQGEEEQLCGC